MVVVAVVVACIDPEEVDAAEDAATGALFSWGAPSEQGTPIALLLEFVAIPPSSVDVVVLIVLCLVPCPPLAPMLLFDRIGGEVIRSPIADTGRFDGVLFFLLLRFDERAC